MKRIDLKFKIYLVLFLTGFLAFLLTIIPIRLSIALHQAPTPQAILVLGGNPAREVRAAQLAQRHPTLDTWVSTGSPPSYVRPIFEAEGIEDDRLHLDYRAVDTVTNFTTLVSDFKDRRIQHIFLVTSDYHMPRATAIATLVLGSQGITFTPVPVGTGAPRESTFRIIRDSGRAILWIVTGRTGASLKHS